MDTTALGRPSRSFSVCSFLLSALFAYSAVVQLNDDDWYVWLPFYSLACLVCLAHGVEFSTVSRLSAYVGLVSGSVLFIKVVSEGCLRGGLMFSWTDFMSLDMDQKLVREKLGSLIVCVALWIELGVSGGAPNEGGWRPASFHTGISIAVIFLLSFTEESKSSLRRQLSFKRDRRCRKSASFAVSKKWKDIASRVLVLQSKQRKDICIKGVGFAGWNVLRCVGKHQFVCCILCWRQSQMDGDDLRQNRNLQVAPN